MASHWSAHWTTWRIPVADRLKRLEAEGQRLSDPSPATATGKLITNDIMEARRRSGVVDGATEDVGTVDEPGLRAWWTGSAIERTWAALHRAEEALLLLADDPYVIQQAVGMRSAVTTWPASDTRTTAYQQTLDRITKADGSVSAPDREALRDIRSAINTRSDERHTRERGLRNTLLMFSGLLLLALIVAWLATDVHGVALFPVPSVTGSATPRPNTLAIEAVAAFGGLISAVAFVQRLQSGAGPYNVAFPQAVLKIATGAAVGLFGVVLVQHGVLSLVVAQDQNHLLGYALLFGFAQQAVTQMADKRADALVDSSPSTRKGPAPTQPSAPAT